MGSWFNFKGSLHLLRVSSLFLHHSFLNGTKEGLCANFQGQRGPGFFQKTWNSYLIGHLQGCLFRPQNTPSFQDLWAYYTSYPWHKDETERHVQEMLSSVLIVPSTSPFASPALLIQKKDGAGDFVWILGGWMPWPSRTNFLCLSLKRSWRNWLAVNILQSWTWNLVIIK